MNEFWYIKLLFSKFGPKSNSNSIEKKALDNWNHFKYTYVEKSISNWHSCRSNKKKENNELGDFHFLKNGFKISNFQDSLVLQSNIYKSTLIFIQAPFFGNSEWAFRRLVRFWRFRKNWNEKNTRILNQNIKWVFCESLDEFIKDWKKKIYIEIEKNEKGENEVHWVWEYILMVLDWYFNGNALKMWFEVLLKH